jgi:hypothetical protein
MVRMFPPFWMKWLAKVWRRARRNEVMAEFG